MVVREPSKANSKCKSKKIYILINFYYMEYFVDVIINSALEIEEEEYIWMYNRIFILSQPERKVLNPKIETKHYKDFLWITTVKTPLKTDDFLNLSLKSSLEQKLYQFEN
jgi:hypothetical protein